MKILVLALSGIGDALMFTPAIQLIKRSNPKAQIEALVMFKGVKDMYERIDEVDKVHYHDFLNSSPLKVFSTVLSFRKKYDASLSVYPSNRREYNIINFLIGAKKRAGVQYLRKGFQNLYWLNNVKILENDEKHNVEQNIELCKQFIDIDSSDIPSLKFPLTDQDKSAAEDVLKNLNLKSEDKIIGFHAGCSTLKNHINRRWSPENFAKLASKIIEKKDYHILLFGGPEELELNNQIVESVGSDKINAVKTKSLSETAAVMNHCDAFVSNDSGLMHISSALGLKTVSVIGPTNKHFILPWKTKYEIASLELDCSPCFFYSPKHLECYRDDVKFKCMKELSHLMVYEKLTKLLKS